MNLDSEDFIDSLLEQYEAIWSSKQSGSENISAFLNSLDGIDLLTVIDRNAVLLELSLIDMERWWMNWEQRVLELSEQSVEVVLQEFERRATTENYLQLFTESANESAVIEALTRCEFAARNNWGDQIGSVYFQSRFGIAENIAGTRISKRIVMRCDREDATCFSPLFPIRGRTIIGRQRSFDASDSLAQELPHGNRIVIASRLESEISREQLVMQLLCPSHAILTNTSSINPIEISNEEEVLPQRSAITKIPFEVHLPGRRLSVFQIAN